MNINTLHSRWVLLLLGVLSIGIGRAYAQNSIRINEVLLENRTGYIDESGERSAWIEFYNPTAATINVGGMFLSDDLSNPTKYPIRSGSKKSIIAPYQTFVVFLDGKAHKGVHHVDMVLDPTQSHTIYLHQGDGVMSLLDQVTVPALGSDVSYARIPDGSGAFQVTEQVSPDELNDYIHGNEKVNEFRNNDPYGLVMTLIAMGTVFVALIVLFFVFKGTGTLFTRKERAVESPSTIPTATKPSASRSEDVYAAISMALYDYNGGPEQVAIAMALYQSGLFGGERSGMIPYDPTRTTTGWSDKTYMMRRRPQ